MLLVGNPTGTTDMYMRRKGERKGFRVRARLITQNRLSTFVALQLAMDRSFGTGSSLFYQLALSQVLLHPAMRNVPPSDPVAGEQDSDRTC